MQLFDGARLLSDGSGQLIARCNSLSKGLFKFGKESHCYFLTIGVLALSASIAAIRAN